MHDKLLIIKDTCSLASISRKLILETHAIVCNTASTMYEVIHLLYRHHMMTIMMIIKPLRA